MSVEELLLHKMGPQRLPLGAALPLSSIYAALIVLGVLGNVLSLYIIIANRAMRTAANLFLCSLAVSDTLLLLCGAPEELLHAWYQYPWTLGETYCAVKAVGLELGNDASILTILLFSLARYFKAHTSARSPLRPDVHSFARVYTLQICANRADLSQHVEHPAARVRLVQVDRVAAHAHLGHFPALQPPLLALYGRHPLPEKTRVHTSGQRSTAFQQHRYTVSVKYCITLFVQHFSTCALYNTNICCYYIV